MVPMMLGIQRHVFDESQFQAVLPGELCQRHDFVFRDAADGDGIQANFSEAGLLGCDNAIEHALQTCSPRQFARKWLPTARRG